MTALDMGLRCVSHITSNTFNVQVFREVTGWVVRTVDLHDGDPLVVDFLLKPKLVDFDVSHLPHTSP